jgi:hypothetical protein
MPTRGQERRNGKESIGATMIMFEIMFLVIAVIALLRLPKDVRRMPERRPSASPVEPEHQMCGHAVSRAPRSIPLTVEEQLTEIWIIEQLAELAPS